MQMEDLEAPVTASDRLTFTVFVAAALHGLLILGVGFTIAEKPHIPPTFEVTLANYESKKPPDKADYKAQFNQEASGVEEQAKEITTDTIAPFSDTQIREVSPVPQVKTVSPDTQTQQLRLHTVAKADTQIAKMEDLEDSQTAEPVDGEEADIPFVSAEVASLRAKLDRQQQAYAKRPRIRRLISVSTERAVDAEYLSKWRQKIEYVANQNFPQQALEDRIFGDLLMLTVIRSDGTIHSVELRRSSGHKILDNAALQAVHQAAPFAPFPAEISKDTDLLEIIQTWRFRITGVSVE